ncbi:helix-turn-helix domain-containing protein [Paraburkholderia sp. XV]|uniref:helix-turn-helix domain-containing protein n=1 Tax=Paraburkholderia sp. XV TaxID=2831520 RepID=UPI001CD54898|nr:helix-turn-helix domain-containing protein [Paraburkholderia sp. XV]
MNLIEQAIQHAGGVTAFTKALNELIERPVTYQAVKKWAARGRLPRTEWTGESHYASAIERVTGGQVSRESLLNPVAAPAAVQHEEGV